jgi:predicted Zn-dependent peptidase
VNLSDYVNFTVDQAEYKATWAFPSHFRLQTLRVFVSVLGEILFNEIRVKRSLAYSIGTTFNNFQDVFEYEISGRISPDATPYIDELVRKCIEMVPSRRDLFDRKLNSLRQRCLMIDLSGYGLAGSSANELASNHRIIPMLEVSNDLQKVTFEQMVEVAALLSSERQYTFITCP